MKRFIWALVAVILAATSPCPAAPLAVYGKLPTIEQAAISPDGDLIAVACTDGDQRVILIMQSKDNAPVARLRAGLAKVRDLSWADSSHLLISASVTGTVADLTTPKSEWLLVISYDLKTGKMANVLDGARNALNAVTAPPSIRILGGKTYAFIQAAHFVQNQGRISLFKVSLDTGMADLLIDGQSDTEGWLVSPTGEPMAESRYNAERGRWLLRVKQKTGWSVAQSIDTGYGYGGELGLGRDGHSVVVGADKDGKDALREFNVDTGAWGETFAVEDSVGAIYDPVTEQLIGSYALAGETDDYEFLSPNDQKIWNATVKAFPGQRVTLQNMSADHRKLIVLVDSPTEGPAYAFVDVGAGKASYIGDAYDLKPQDVAPVRPVSYKAADGQALTGYLTLPRGKDPKALPLVVFPHGGPAARDEPAFDWWAQAMAAQGYAVLQVNYRGSDGFGWEFLSAGFGEWGHKMQTDLSDGVRYLAAQGVVDPKRVCIVGASYGGYAALAGATLDPDVYRCAVSVAGISDLKRFVAWGKDRSDVSTERYWDRYMGAAGSGDPHLQQISPAAQVARVRAPILLVHGKDDTVVPFEQSQIMADALKRAGKPYDLVILNHEDHWLSHGDTRLQMLQATIDFLEKYNPPG